MVFTTIVAALALPALAGLSRERVEQPLIVMDSPSQVNAIRYGYPPASQPDAALRTSLRGINASLAEVAKMPIAAQRRALVAFIDECDRYWRAHVAANEEPAYRPKERRYVLDCAKLDWFALARGGRPIIAHVPLLWRMALGSAGKVSVREPFFAPLGGPGYSWQPTTSLTDIARAKKLAASGYFDLPAPRSPRPQRRAEPIGSRKRNAESALAPRPARRAAAPEARPSDSG